MLVSLHLNHHILRETQTTQSKFKGESNQDLGRREGQGSTNWIFTGLSFSEVSLLQETTTSLLCYFDTGPHPEKCDLVMERFGNHVTREE